MQLPPILTKSIIYTGLAVVFTGLRHLFTPMKSEIEVGANLIGFTLLNISMWSLVRHNTAAKNPSTTYTSVQNLAATDRNLELEQPDADLHVEQKQSAADPDLEKEQPKDLDRLEQLQTEVPDNNNVANNKHNNSIDSDNAYLNQFQLGRKVVVLANGEEAKRSLRKKKAPVYYGTSHKQTATKKFAS